MTAAKADASTHHKPGFGTLRLWEAPSGGSLATLAGHSGTVWVAGLAGDGRMLGSGSHDGTVRLWETSSGACLHTLQAERRYERLDITGMSGVTEAPARRPLSPRRLGAGVLT